MNKAYGDKSEGGEEIQKEGGKRTGMYIDLRPNNTCSEFFVYGKYVSLKYTACFSFKKKFLPYDFCVFSNLMYFSANCWKWC